MSMTKRRFEIRAFFDLHKMVQLENIATPENCTIITTTSDIISFPIETILGTNLKQFWPTTGVYPQEFIVQFPSPIKTFKIILSLRKVEELQVYFQLMDRYELFAEQGRLVLN
jgi:hypothetical protein